MKSALISGLIIGILSGAWLLVLYLIGYETFISDTLSILISGKSFKDTSILLFIAILIPIIGLYFGLRQYKYQVKGGIITFSEGMLRSFKILITGGILAIIFSIIYIHFTTKGTISEFIEIAVGALLVGLATALIISYILKAKSK